MNKNYILIAILVLAAVLRLWGLERGDTMNDEVFYGFRAIGLLDFDAAERQTTPLEWFDGNIPSWTKLSFHDHPPLVFWIQHAFMKVFGESAWAFRLPSALLGVASVYLLYLWGRNLYSIRVGLLASALMAVTLNHVYISRIGLQESYVIFFLLLASYFFLKSLRNENYLIWTGVALGFGFLAKFTLFILVPVFLTYFLFFRRDYFRRAKFWIGAALSILIFSPVIIYNLKLYQAVGHLDFQFSSLFGQNPEVWREQPGKEIGTLAERLRALVPRLISTHSWLFLAAVASSLAAFFAGLSTRLSLVDTRLSLVSRHAFLLIFIFFLTVFVVFVLGPSFRFLAMLTPFLALAAAVFFSYVQAKLRWQTAGLFLGAFLAFEIFYSYNNQISYYPAGAQPGFSSKIRFENYNWGYNDLDHYLSEEFAGKMPALTFNPVYKFLDDIRESALTEARARGLEAEPFLVVYGGNFDDGALLWVLLRRHVYDAWPIVSFGDYFKFLDAEGRDYFARAGFKSVYFVVANNSLLSPREREALRGGTPELIKNRRGDEAFQVYRISVN